MGEREGMRNSGWWRVYSDNNIFVVPDDATRLLTMKDVVDVAINVAADVVATL